MLGKFCVSFHLFQLLEFNNSGGSAMLRNEKLLLLTLEAATFSAVGADQHTRGDKQDKHASSDDCNHG